MSRTPTLNEVLEGNVPLTSNHDQLAELGRLRESRILALVLAPGVQLRTGFIPPLLDVLETLPEGGGLDLFVDTLGAASEESWRIVSMLRARFDRYTAIVPFAATPGATQIALGADELMMGEASSLAPIEPARLKAVRDDDGENRTMSAYDVHHYLQFVQRALGVDRLPPDSPLWTALVNRVDPMVIGITEKAHQINRLVTRRCLETHIDPETDDARIEAVLDEVGAGTLGRRFPITRRDCERRLGLDVIKPAREIGQAVWALHAYYRQMLDLEGDLQLGDKQHYTVGYDGFIDTLEERRVLLRITRVDEHGRPIATKPVLHRWVSPVGRDVVLDEELEL